MLKTLYVKRELTNAAEVAKWAKAQGFESVVTDPHVTLAFSRAMVDHEVLPADTLGAKLTVEGGARSVERLGTEGATVLLFESADLAGRWQALKDAGAAWGHPSYLAHVTISYSMPPDLDLSTVEPFDGPLIFGPEIVQEINERWRDSIAEKADTMSRQIETRMAEVAKVDADLGLVFGFAMVCLEKGERHFDLQGDHIPEDVMLKAAADFMESDRIAGDMHVKGDDGLAVQKGQVVFAFPMTSDIAKALGITTEKTGLLIAMKPSDPAILAKFKDGSYTGFSIGGWAEDEPEAA